MIRRQLPAYSPLPLRALMRAITRPKRDAAVQLERIIRDRFEAESAVFCGSGTQALQLALEAVQRAATSADAPVALPAFSCYDVASAAVGANATVVFYDVEPETLTPDWESFERALGYEPVAVVVAPLYGYQPDWDRLRALTRRSGVLLIEDAAQSHGARWKGRPAGGVGDVSVLSFGRGKGWTGVEGGALLGPSELLEPVSSSLSPASAAAAVRVLLKGFAQWGLGRPSLYGIPSVLPGLALGETVYHPPVPLQALSSLSARLVLETSSAAEQEAEVRHERARTLSERLDQSGLAHVPQPTRDSVPGTIRLPVRVGAPLRERVLEEGFRWGIMPSYPRALPALPQIRPQIIVDTAYPGAQSLSERLFTLPVHSLVTQRDMSRILALFGCGDD